MIDTKALARHYANLTPEERFRLILAAGSRGDKAERDRLVNSGGRIALSLQDHAPYAIAFEELASLVFIDFLEEAACYWEAFARADDAHDLLGYDDEEGADDEEETAEEAQTAEAEQSAAEVETRSAAGDGGAWSIWEGYLDLALAAGFVLRTKAEGWKLFCERMTIPPFALWEGLPGFDRLQRVLKLAERVAFTPEGFLRWWNDIRPSGEAKRTEILLTVEGVAVATEEIFRKHVAWWSG